MPKNRIQAVVFSILMSASMAFGMEVYNTAWQMGFAQTPGGFSNMTNEVFLRALGETAFMVPIVFVVSTLWGNRTGASLAERLVDPQSDSRLLCTLARSGCTVLVMCPAMSLVASVLFSVVLAGMPVTQLPAIWVGTVIKNFPMALCWNIFFAGPASRAVFARCFARLGEKSAGAEAA